MRKILTVLAVLAMLLTTACAQTPATAPVTAEPTPVATEAPAQLQKDLVILYTNDVHCAVDDAIGYAGLAAYKKQLEADGNHVLLVDVGDAVQGAPIGTVSKGSIIIDIMNEVGYDVATIGNHEFDYGMPRFFELVEQANFPYVSANFTDLKTGEPVLEPYTMLEVDGLKFAFVGITTPKTLTTSTPAYFQDETGEFVYGFLQDATGEKVYAAVQSAVDAARAAGADYVIGLAHLGITMDASPWTSSEVILNTAGIDVVLDGHSHSVLESERVKNKNGEWTLLSSTGTKLESIGMLLLTKSGNITTGLISDYAEKDADVDGFIKSAQAEFEEMLGTVVAKTDVDLTITEPGTDVRIVRNAETNLGDLCADAYRAIGGADIAIVNGGGVRASIPAGDITLGQIISVHPFGNSLCVIEATGQEILDALEMSVRVTPEENGGFLQVSGLSFEINVKTPSSVTLDENGLFVSVDGDRRVQNVMVGDQPIDPAKTYTLASHDYLIKNAGDGYTMFQDNTLLQDSIMLDNQVLINYITDYLDGVIGADYAEPYGQERIISAK
ncbi:MAG: bifunctional UDP-sugar hydrolase/5'-nucleotidase [Candidatus Pelethousia sp.]|nr:bifunctional UDP-sugar hydrolase/5'-nucleotidase [Candidatus Pelethousia sp.]